MLVFVFFGNGWIGDVYILNWIDRRVVTIYQIRVFWVTEYHANEIVGGDGGRAE